MPGVEVEQPPRGLGLKRGQPLDRRRGVTGDVLGAGKLDGRGSGQEPVGAIGTGEHFALEVRGDSMIEAGIHENDTVILRKQDTAETGDIVVALIDEEEATLKRLRRRGASIALEAANPAYETRIFGPDRVRIQGKLVSLLRRY